jgi:PAS domain S-box-containing protein
VPIGPRRSDVALRPLARPGSPAGPAAGEGERLALEAELAHLEATAHLGSWRWDAAGGTVSWSPEFARIWRLAAIEAPATPERLCERVHPDDRERVRSTLVPVVRTGTAFDLRCRLRPSGGAETTVRLRGQRAEGEGDGTLIIRGTAQDVSEEESRERALRAAEERFRIIFEEAPAGVAVVGLDGRFLRVNRALCDFLGYSCEELEDRTFQELTHPDDLDRDVAQAERVRAGEISHYVTDKRYRRRDGSMVWAQLSVSLARDPRGEPLSYISHVVDISEQRAAQEELAAAHARLAEAQEIADVGSWEVDLRTGGRSISAQLWRILGLRPRPEPLHLDEYAEHVPPGEREWVRDTLLPVRRGAERAATIEHRFRRDDGDIVSLLVSVRTEVDDEGHLLSVRGTTQDVTRLRAAEAARRRAEARFAVAFELAPIGMGICALDGRFVQVNQALWSSRPGPRSTSPTPGT